MEQTDSGKAHDHSILVTGIDHIVITDRSARLGNVFYTALVCALDIVSEWEERIRTKCNIRILVKPCALLLSGKDIRLYLEDILPCAVRKDIHIILTHVQIDRIVTVRTLDSVNEL